MDRGLVLLGRIETVLREGLEGTLGRAFAIGGCRASGYGALAEARDRGAVAVILPRHELADLDPGAASVLALGISCASCDVLVAYQGRLSQLPDASPARLVSVILGSPGSS